MNISKFCIKNLSAFFVLCSLQFTLISQDSRTICASGLTLTISSSPTNYALEGNPPVIPGFTTPLPSSLGLIDNLTLTFARHDISRTPGVCGTAPFVDELRYRVYKMGSPVPSFSILNVSGGGTDIGVCTTNNFHKKASPAIPISLIPSSPECGQTYILEFQNYTKANSTSGSCEDATSVFTTNFVYGGYVEYSGMCYTTIQDAITASAGIGTINIVGSNLSSENITIANTQTITLANNVSYTNTGVLVNNGLLKLLTNAQLINQGTYKGIGVIQGPIVNDGNVIPGN